MKEIDRWVCSNCGRIELDSVVKLMKFNILDIKCVCGAVNQKNLHFKKGVK